MVGRRKSDRSFSGVNEGPLGKNAFFAVLAEGESLRGTKKVIPREESLESIASFRSNPSLRFGSNTWSYWLSFPASMREVLMSTK